MSDVRTPNGVVQEFTDPVFLLAGIAATATCGLETAQRPMRIDSVELFSDTTIPSSGSNFYVFNLRVGGRSCATFTINGNAITAGLAAAMAMVAESGQNRVAAKGELIDCVCTLTGTLTINVRVVIHARYVG
jgi:hypothetical protein